MDTWIERTCRTHCFRQAVVLGLATILGGLVTATIASGSWDTLTGPHRVDAATLVGAQQAAEVGHELVEFECGDAVDTGVAWVVTRGSSSRSTPFWAVPIGDRALLVKSQERPAGRVVGVVGQLEPGIGAKFDADERKVLLPYQVEVRDPRPIVWIGMLIFAGATAWLGGSAARSLRRWADPRRHPAVAGILADLLDLDSVSAQVEAELAAPDVLRLRGRSFTRNFLVDARALNFDVRRWRDLAWAFKKVTRTRLYGIIPAGSTYEPAFVFSDGRRIVLRGRWRFGKEASEGAVDGALALAAERAPWAVIGWDGNLERGWRKRRAEFLDAVARRRAEAESRASA